MEAIAAPTIKLLYDGKDITTDVSAHLISATYTDKAEFESDELEVVLHDAEDLWKDSWFPDKGSKLKFDYGYADLMVSAGEFEIDEIELTGGPSGDLVTMRGLAAGITKATRTKRSRALEDATLRKVAETVAGENGFQVDGKIDNIQLKRVTQNRETDLQFLRRISEQYGYLFNIRGRKLIFTKKADIEKSDSVAAVDRSEVTSWSVRDKATDTFEAAEVRYSDPALKEITIYRTDSTQLGGDVSYKDIIRPDTIQIRQKAENAQQAKTMAEAALAAANSLMVEGSISLYGAPTLVAGSNFDLTGFRKLTGKYHIIESRHTITRQGGYVTELTIKRVEKLAASKEAPKTQRKPAGFGI